jgi:hypothetical protein
VEKEETPREETQDEREEVMADLDKHSDREDWIRWAVEFMRRGIWPEETITVHGPHSPPANLMWGQMGDYEFATPHNTPMHDPRGVRVWLVVGSSWDKEACPLLPQSELDTKQRRWLRAARRTLARLESQRQAEQQAQRRVIAMLKGGNDHEG